MNEGPSSSTRSEEEEGLSPYPTPTPGRPTPTPSGFPLGKPSIEQVPNRPPPLAEGGRDNNHIKNSQCEGRGPQRHFDPPPGINPFANYPLYHVIRSGTDTKLGDMNAIKVNRDLERLLGSTDLDITDLRDGSLLIKVGSLAQSKALEGLKSLANSKVTATPHEKLNSSQGTVVAYKARYLGVKEILQDLQEHKFPVTDVYRFPPTREDPNSPNPRLLITFSTPYPPSQIKIAYYRQLGVRLFVPRPRRCLGCQRFGHPQKYCRTKKRICEKCGANSHPRKECKPPHFCINCNGEHSAASRKCPKYEFEQEVLRVRTEQKKSDRDARILVKEYMEDKGETKGNAYSSQNNKRKRDKTMNYAGAVKSAASTQSNGTTAASPPKNKNKNANANPVELCQQSQG